MAKISQSIKTLKGGVSQQPEILKRPEQGNKQVNGWSSETSGLKKRPPFVFKKILGDKNLFGESPLFHLINRDEQERYYVVFTGSDIKVYDLSGNEYRVDGNKDYVRVPRPRDQLKMLTIADYTFVVNTTKEVHQGTTKHLQDFNTKKQALINVKGGQYGRVLKVFINGEEVSRKTLPTGGNQYDVKELDAQAIAEVLTSGINSWGTSKGITATAGNGFIEVKAAGSTLINSIKTEDGYADQLLNVVTHYVQSVNKLPLNAPDGYIVKVTGNLEKSTDAYYVQYDAAEKVWKETLGWDVIKGLDKNTMPHVLVRESSGNFTFKPADWSDRSSGDEDTNPQPSFVAGTINDVFLYRNRLGLLSGENVIFSRTGKYFNFYPASVATLSDDDPIDVAVSSDRINILKYAVPFANELLLWSDEAQFILSSGQGAFTASTLSLDMATSYDVSDKARPFALGKSVYYANPRAGYTSIGRYYSVQDVSQVKASEDITSYVPDYIPNGVFNIRGSTTERFCTVLTSGAKSTVFVYKFLYINEQIAQQSWSEWSLGEDCEVLACDTIGSYMFPVIRNGKHTFIGSLSFTEFTKDYSSEPYRYYMDYKKSYLTPSSAYDVDKGVTIYALPQIYGTIELPFERGTFVVCTKGGKVYEFNPKGSVWSGSDKIFIDGNLAGQEVFVGISFKFEYEFSKFLIKEYDNFGNVNTVDSGRLQLQRAWIDHQLSGSFDVSVYNSTTTYKYTMTGISLGAKSSELGKLNLSTGKFKFPCAGKADRVSVTVTSSFPAPVCLIGAGWEANYVRKTTRI